VELVAYIVPLRRSNRTVNSSLLGYCFPVDSPSPVKVFWRAQLQHGYFLGIATADKAANRATIFHKLQSRGVNRTPTDLRHRHSLLVPKILQWLRHARNAYIIKTTLRGYDTLMRYHHHRTLRSSWTSRIRVYKTTHLQDMRRDYQESSRSTSRLTRSLVCP